MTEAEKVTKWSNVLWESMGNIHKAGLETEAIIAELEKQLEAINSPFTYEYTDGDDTKEYLGNPAFYFWGTLKGKDKRTKLGHLTYGFSFWQDHDEMGEAWAGAHQAKVYVGYDTPAPDGGGWGQEDLFIRGNRTSSEGAEKCPSSDFLWEYVEKGGKTEEFPWCKRQWFYAVPLGAINTPEDVARNLINPVVALLSEKKPKFEETGAYSFSDLSDNTTK
ncbi:MAG: hypothetical protein COB46_03555 [Rhodospirillaceae bacterium]|nr:MAG: hypothetical protein COB46_03555 [Rhodospirillaceae bacterium]